MTARQLFVAGAAVLAGAFSAGAAAQPAAERYVQVAHIEIDPVQLQEYRAAVREQITAAIRDEPGVLVLCAMSDRDNPACVTVFELYRDAAAYQAHLASAHFKKYKAATEKMLKSLTLVKSDPILLGAKGK
jgi:quinol monooxygenase YgiN